MGRRKNTLNHEQVEFVAAFLRLDGQAKRSLPLGIPHGQVLSIEGDSAHRLKERGPKISRIRSVGCCISRTEPLGSEEEERAQFCSVLCKRTRRRSRRHTEIEKSGFCLDWVADEREEISVASVSSGPLVCSKIRRSGTSSICCSSQIKTEKEQIELQKEKRDEALLVFRLKIQDQTLFGLAEKERGGIAEVVPTAACRRRRRGKARSFSFGLQRAHRTVFLRKEKTPVRSVADNHRSKAVSPILVSRIGHRSFKTKKGSSLQTLSPSPGDRSLKTAQLSEEQQQLPISATADSSCSTFPSLSPVQQDRNRSKCRLGQVKVKPNMLDKSPTSRMLTSASTSAESSTINGRLDHDRGPELVFAYWSHMNQDFKFVFAYTLVVIRLHSRFFQYFEEHFFISF